MAGLWSASYSLGEVIGPTAGGLLLQYYGFPVAATAMAGVNFLLVIICIVYFNYKKMKSEKSDKKITEGQLGNGAEGVWKISPINECEDRTN